MVVQRFRDLYEINHRLQGLAEKIYKTHQIVLTKLIKLGVRSAKRLQVGSMCKESKRSRV
jgi:hypothetical protein